jgi:hypothetical protein
MKLHELHPAEGSRHLVTVKHLVVDKKVKNHVQVVAYV